MFFLGMLYRLISFLAVYKAFLAGLSVGVYFCIGVAAGVMGTWLIYILLVVVAVCKVGV